MNQLRHLAAAISGYLCIAAASAQSHNIPFENGTLTLTPLQDNAVRIRYSEGEIKEMPEWIYTENVGKVKCRRTEKDGKSIFQLSAMTVTAADGNVEVTDNEGRKTRTYRRTRARRRSDSILPQGQ